MPNDAKLPTPTHEDLERIRKTLRTIGGQNVVWGAQQSLDVWVIEQRAAQDARVARRLLIATWALVLATVALVFATLAMIFAPR